MSTGMDPEAYEAALASVLGRNKGLNLGPFFLGFLIDIALWGIMINQFLQWRARRRRERVLVRIVVYWIVFFSTVISATTTAWMWEVFIAHFGLYAPLATLKWVGWYPILNVFISVPAQAFYLDRVWRLSKAKWIPIALVPIMLLSVAGATAQRVRSWTLVIEEAWRMRDLFYIWIGSTLVVDAALTGTILYHLLHARSGEPISNRFINRLIRLSIESQLPSTLVAIAFMIQYPVAPSSPIGPFFCIMHSKVYVVPLMAVINARRAIRQELNMTAVTTQQDGPMQGPPPRHAGSLDRGTANKFSFPNGQRSEMPLPPYHSTVSAPRSGVCSETGTTGSLRWEEPTQESASVQRSSSPV